MFTSFLQMQASGALLVAKVSVANLISTLPTADLFDGGAPQQTTTRSSISRSHKASSFLPRNHRQAGAWET
ncbi:hypothetical protein CABS01_00590 [Colletotrichum abscissum]|uniref:uncharacterized protein n=1 Tax=Colletotrichum abscissum TaxID=1671311 RepID=UPI0027D73955|nr:uncharacterized protein CABS01_00590 [Colletotrichum abscissum]KAK1525501.1 hypothetical protein CABS01_00590 [Colletotrichum abscissum]KAK1712341.1 hypothetical protein BDP67DRAFT_517188 [Colletotrichum lupini]